MAENNPTKWESSFPEPRTWTLTNTIMATMGGLIITLLLLGFNSINSKIETGDKLVRDEIMAGNKDAMDQIKEIKDQNKEISNNFLKLSQDVSRIDANQAARMKKDENRAKMRGGR